MSRAKFIPCSGCQRMIKRYRARKDAECARCLAASKRQWYLDHRQERLAAERARWRTGVKTASINEWRAAHPEKCRAYRRAYVERMRLSLRDERRPRCECGMTHTPPSRLAILRRMDGCEPVEIREAWPCIWSGPSGEKKLFRDLAALRATRGKRAA